jgi:intracellular sulfur oxidation DsrE/DsrF family protein
MRKLLCQLTVASMVCLSMASVALAQAAKPQSSAKAQGSAKPQSSAKLHRLLIHVDQNDPAVMNLALNNATNVIEHYRAKGEDVDVDIVAYGPGLNMLRADTSPVQDRIKQLKGNAFPSKVQFSACANTKENMEKKEGRPVAVLPDATIVASGVVQLMEKQEEGWSYIRP